MQLTHATLCPTGDFCVLDIPLHQGKPQQLQHVNSDFCQQYSWCTSTLIHAGGSCPRGGFGYGLCQCPWSFPIPGLSHPFCPKQPSPHLCRPCPGHTCSSRHPDSCWHTWEHSDLPASMLGPCTVAKHFMALSQQCASGTHVPPEHPLDQWVPTWGSGSFPPRKWEPLYSHLRGVARMVTAVTEHHWLHCSSKKGSFYGTWG